METPPRFLAAVDLGSNSFRMMIGEIQGSSVCPVQVFKEPVRLGAGLDEQRCLTEAAQAKVLACLGRFAEALRAIPAEGVRVVATHAFRQARNAHIILPKAEAILGFPINIISGEEEARLIFRGVMHSLPFSEERRLIIDIGGGSTECVIGDYNKIDYLCSLEMGCVSWSTRFFASGELTASAFRDAELAAQSTLEPVKHVLQKIGWDAAYASSGTARALMDVVETNGWGQGIMTLPVLERLKQALLVAGSVDRLQLAGLPKERMPVLAGGLSLMIGVQKALELEKVMAAEGALQLGVLYDLFQAQESYDLRSESVMRVAERYGIDQVHANRIALEAIALFEQMVGQPSIEAERMLVWATWLHEIGVGLQRNQAERHAAYLTQYAELPGFSWRDQYVLSSLVLLQKGDLSPFRARLQEPLFRAQVMALRLAIIKYLNRSDEVRPNWTLRLASTDRVNLLWSQACRQHYPMTTWLLEEECRQWQSAGVNFSVVDFEEPSL